MSVLRTVRTFLRMEMPVNALMRGFLGGFLLLAAPSSFGQNAQELPQESPAAMVTDTANLRNRAYHSDGDRPDRLDYRRMAMVVVGVDRVLRVLGK